MAGSLPATTSPRARKLLDTISEQQQPCGNSHLYFGDGHDFNANDTVVVPLTLTAGGSCFFDVSQQRYLIISA